MNNGEFRREWRRLTESPAGLEIEAALLGIMAELHPTTRAEKVTPDEVLDPGAVMQKMFPGVEPAEGAEPTEGTWITVSVGEDAIDAYVTDDDLRIVIVMSMSRDGAADFIEMHNNYMEHDCEESMVAFDELLASIAEHVGASLWGQFADDEATNEEDDDDEPPAGGFFGFGWPG